MTNNVAAAAELASSHAFLDSAKTYIAYIGVIGGAIVVAFTGIRKALKDLRETGGTVRSPAVSQVVGGTIMETTTLLMWSESNRDNMEAITALIEKLESVVNCVNFNTEAQRNMTKEVNELRHQVERLRDKMT